MESGAGATVVCEMSTPYLSDFFTDGGTAVLFTPHDGVETANVDSSDLSAAVNALYFNDETRWPEEGGSNVPLKTWLVDCPDAHATVNWLAATHTSWIPGVVALAPATDAAGTVPYVNPANSSDVDAIYALNYLIDHL